MGRDLGGTGGDGPPKFEMGDGPWIRPQNISRSSVIGCVGKYEGGIFWVKLEVIREGKGHNMKSI